MKSGSLIYFKDEDKFLIYPNKKTPPGFWVAAPLYIYLDGNIDKSLLLKEIIIIFNHAECRMAYYPVDENGQPAPHWQSELVIKDHLENNRLFLCDKNGNGRVELKVHSGPYRIFDSSVQFGTFVKLKAIL